MEEGELETAERHVREGEANVARQMEIVAVLRRNGYTGGRAERLLAAFQASLAERREHLDALRHVHALSGPRRNALTDLLARQDFSND